MNPTADPILERLAATRPGRDEPPVSPDERRQILAAILSSEDLPASRGLPRLPRPALALLGGSVAATVALATALVGVVDDPRTPGRVAATPAPDGRSVVLDRVRLAVSEADGLILHVRTDHGTGVLWEAWFDPTEQQSRSRSSGLDGTPMYDHQFSPDGDGSRVRVVSYSDEAWWEYRTDRVVAHGWSAADIRRHLDAGTLVEVAKEQRDGRSELHLRWAPEEAPAGVRMQPGDLWVDASTYLPARSIGDDRGRRVTMDFEWLERTPENTSALHAPVPPGFRRLPGAPEAPAGGPGQG